MKIYIFVIEAKHSSGHGMISDSYELPSIDPWQKDTLYPCFKTRESAERYKKALGEFNRYKILEIEVTEDN